MVVCSWCPFHQNARRRIRTRGISCQPCCAQYWRDEPCSEMGGIRMQPVLRAACCRHGMTKATSTCN